MEGDEFRFLRVSGRIFNGLGWGALIVFGVIGLVILITGGGPDISRSMGWVGLFLGSIYFLIFRTIGSIVKLLLEIESRIKP